jgi:hypothetical protein
MPPMRITTPAIQEFDYRPHPALAVAMIPCCCGGIAIGWWLAFYPPVGGIGSELRHIWLSQQQTRWLGTFLLAASPISVLAVIGLIRVAFFSERRVAITEDSLIVPKPTRMGVSCDEIEILFSEITRVALTNDVNGVRCLRIDHPGRKVYLAGNMFRSRGIFDAMAQAVMKAVDGETPVEELEDE